MPQEKNNNMNLCGLCRKKCRNIISVCVHITSNSEDFEVPAADFGVSVFVDILSRD
jgi:hypothetical protein